MILVVCVEDDVLVISEEGRRGLPPSLEASGISDDLVVVSPYMPVRIRVVCYLVLSFSYQNCEGLR